MAATMRRKMIDIGANLTDPMFRGIYHGSQKHPDDINQVIDRALKNGVDKIVITGGSLEESVAALSLAETNGSLYSTVGCHPTRCNEFEPNSDQYLEKLIELAKQNRKKIVAIGELGLDYDRLEFCPKETQKKYFEKQLLLSEETKLPLFLHCRNAANDLVEILEKNREKFQKGVVHSFDGTKQEAKEFLDMGLYIGINGCSLKTEENLSTVAELPRDKIMIETDCPWCDVRPTHSGYKYIKSVAQSVKKEKWKDGSQVKGRNEPINLQYIIDILCSVRDEDEEEFTQKIYQNTIDFFAFDKM